MKVFCGVVPLDFSSISDDVVAAYQTLGHGYEVHRSGSLLIVIEGERRARYERGTTRFLGDVEIFSVDGQEVSGDRAIDRLLRTFERDRESVIARVRGDFSFAIVDEKERTITLARDHLGVRALYWSVVEGDLVFSNVASLVAHHPRYRFDVDRYGVAMGILEGDGEVERTYWRSIARLPAATWVRWKGGRKKAHRYWRLGTKSVSMSLADAVDGYRETFLQAIRRRYRDGKTGAFLSGGLDSSSVVCAAAHAGLDIPTFTLRFPDDEAADEGRFVEMVVRRYGLANSEVEVRSPGSIKPWKPESSTGSPDVFYYPNLQMLEPLYDAATAAGVERLLDGLGGDHLLHATAAPLDLIGAAVREARWSDAARYWREWLLMNRAGGVRPALRLLLGRAAPSAARFLWSRWRGQFPARYTPLSLAVRPGVVGALYPRRRAAFFNQTKQSTVESVTSRWHLERWLEQNYLLTHCHGIEQASPYIDIDFVEFVLSVPIEHLFNRYQTRWLQRESMKGILPDEIRMRNDKGAFHQVVEIALMEQIPLATDFIESKGIDASALVVDLAKMNRWAAEVRTGGAGWEVLMFIGSLNSEHWLAQARSGAVFPGSEEGMSNNGL